MPIKHAMADFFFLKKNIFMNAKFDFLLTMPNSGYTTIWKRTTIPKAQYPEGNVKRMLNVASPNRRSMCTK